MHKNKMAALKMKGQQTKWAPTMNQGTEASFPVQDAYAGPEIFRCSKVEDEYAQLARI